MTSVTFNMSHDHLFNHQVIINKVTLALGLGKLGYSATRLLAIRDPNFGSELHTLTWEIPFYSLVRYREPSKFLNLLEGLASFFFAKGRKRLSVFELYWEYLHRLSVCTRPSGSTDARHDRSHTSWTIFLFRGSSTCFWDSESSTHCKHGKIWQI